MGMNYYLRKKSIYPCKDEQYFHNDTVQELSNGYVFKNTYYPSLDELNKVYYREYHIGKNSAGWHFLLATYPDENINTLNDWKKLFKDNLIYDEEDQLISTEKMINLIENKPEWNIKNLNCNTNNYILGKRNLFKHTDNHIIDNNTSGTYDISDDWNFS